MRYKNFEEYLETVKKKKKKNLRNRKPRKWRETGVQVGGNGQETFCECKYHNSGTSMAVQ